MAVAAATEYPRRRRGGAATRLRAIHPRNIPRAIHPRNIPRRYDDGESETRVREDLIKATDSDSDDDRRGGGGRLREGDKIEADYRGRGKYYPGKIRREHSDDTYDVDYVDGERETRVAKRLIRKKDRSRSRSPSPKRGRKLREGAKVEARYRGRSKYYPGKIRREHSDGTSRGRAEISRLEEIPCRPPPRTIHVVAAAPPRSASAEGLHGMIVAAALPRSASAEGLHGITPRYDVDYDDGEKETRVREDLIKATDSDSDDDRRGGGRLREGDKIEADYRGRGKYYPGKIRRDRGDDT